MTDPREGATTEAQTITLPEPPSANRWWRKWRGRMVKSEAAREYQENVGLILEILRVKKINAPATVRLSLHWWRADKAGDLDKRLGITLDALQGYLYDNDSQIVQINAYRHDLHPKRRKRGEPKKSPFVAIVVEPAP